MGITERDKELILLLCERKISIEDFKTFTKFIANKEISNILVSDLKDKDEQIKYLSFLLDNSYLNEKNIDLIEIEISYRANNNSFEVESSFISSEPDTFKSLMINGTFEQIAPKIEVFIKSCYDMYPEIVRLYTIKNN